VQGEQRLKCVTGPYHRPWSQLSDLATSHGPLPPIMDPHHQPWALTTTHGPSPPAMGPYHHPWTLTTSHGTYHHPRTLTNSHGPLPPTTTLLRCIDGNSLELKLMGGVTMVMTAQWVDGALALHQVHAPAHHSSCWGVLSTAPPAGVSRTSLGIFTAKDC
jgi:hypothetical protein